MMKIPIPRATTLHPNRSEISGSAPPIAHAIGVDLVHFGVIMTVNLAIGMFTPPFGLNIFVAQALFRAPLSSIYPGLVPFIIINLIALALVTYIPELSLFLLQYMG